MDLKFPAIPDDVAPVKRPARVTRKQLEPLRAALQKAATAVPLPEGPAESIAQARAVEALEALAMLARVEESAARLGLFDD